IGEDTAQVNGQETALSQPAQIIGGRTMVPLAFVAQALQADVKWDGNTRTININQNQEGAGTTELTFNGKQVVDMFFSSLGSREVDDAMSLMDAELLGNDAARAAWRSLFSSFDTLQVKSITDWNPGEWTLDQQAFKVEFSLQLKNGAPETMWMDGLNTRWVFVKPVNGQGKISQLATGP
ncbi:MAG: copper amine oxidase N-terminal domain-containing protein, partial [Syntrophomonas sp.]